MIRRPPRSTRTDHSFPTRRSSDLLRARRRLPTFEFGAAYQHRHTLDGRLVEAARHNLGNRQLLLDVKLEQRIEDFVRRSEEHTSELQSLMRNSYAVFCLKKQKHTNT